MLIKDYTNQSVIGKLFDYVYELKLNGKNGGVNVKITENRQNIQRFLI